MESPTQQTWVWASLGSWWWTGRPGVLQSMWSQRVRHDLSYWTELNWSNLIKMYPAYLKEFLITNDGEILWNLKLITNSFIPFFFYFTNVYWALLMHQELCLRLEISRWELSFSCLWAVPVSGGDTLYINYYLLGMGTSQSLQKVARAATNSLFSQTPLLCSLVLLGEHPGSLYLELGWECNGPDA